MRLSFFILYCTFFSFGLTTAHATTKQPPVDPLNSVQWDTMYHAFLKQHPIHFDDRVQILAPESAEDSMHVPVAVKIHDLPNIQKVLVFADFNPLPKILEFFPNNAEPFLAFDIKLQQASPIRAAVLTQDGWHVGGRWVEAAGGGCTLPSAGRTEGNWEATLGQIHGKIWSRDDGSQRIRVRVMHPMDTGLASGIPPFYIESLQLTAADGTPLTLIKPFEPVGENPLFSIDLGTKNAVTQTVSLTVVDSNGNEFEGQLTP